MRISHLIFTTTLVTFLSGLSLGAHAADGAIKVTSAAQIEVEVVGKDGKKSSNIVR